MEYHGFSFQAGRPRRLLAANEVRPAPPPSSSSLCVDMKSGATIRCTNPHAMVMVMAGMACMVFLVCVALALLCWSVVKQRRLRRQHAANPQSPLAPAPSPPPQLSASAADSAAQYDDAVLVQLPGDEKPQSFAIPKPFLADGEKDVESSKVPVDEKAAKEAKSEPPDERRDRDSVGVD